MAATVRKLSVNMHSEKVPRNSVFVHQAINERGESSPLIGSCEYASL